MSVSARVAVSREGAFACEADGSISCPDRDVSSQVAECREPAVLMQSIQQKRSPTGCQPTRGSELRRRSHPRVVHVPCDASQVDECEEEPCE